MQARIAGIKAAGADNVKSAVEFNNVHSLENQDMPSLLNNVVPQIDPDYYSYSSYESINVSPEQTAEDIDYIRSKLSSYGKNPNSLFIGEVGFDANAFGADLASSKLSDIISVVQEKNIPYLIVWNLIDNSSFGVYNHLGEITPYGTAILNFLNPPIAHYGITGAQGYNSITGKYTDYTGLDNQFLILYGNFNPNGNTVSINGISFTPIYDSETQINVRLDSQILPGTPSGLAVPVSVIDNNSLATTSPVTFTLLSADASIQVQGFDASTGIFTPNSVPNNGYMVILGSFSTSGNTVLINGKAVTPTFQLSNEILVKMDSGVIQSLSGNTAATVAVENKNHKLTKPVSVTITSSGSTQNK